MRGWPVEMPGRGTHCGGAAAAHVVHPGVGLGSPVRRGPDGSGLSAADDMQEVNSMKPVNDVKLRMMCVRVPKALRGMVRWMAKRRA